jgi:Leucine-rich repeat (LRR) protein
MSPNGQYPKPISMKCSKIVFPTLFVIFSATAFSYAEFSTGYPAERTYSAERHAVAAPADDAGYTSSAHSGEAMGMHATNNRKAEATLAATDEESVPVIWTELVGVNFDPARGLLTKDRAARRGWNSGAVSVQRLEAGEDGWFETKLRGRYNMVAFGFSDANDDNSYRSIDYCLYVTRFSVQVYENGQRMGHFSRYQQGDKFGIRREGGIIYYQKNGVTFYQSTRPSSGPLMIDASLLRLQSFISGMTTSLDADKPQVPPTSDIVVSDVGPDRSTISWTNGGGDGRIVVASVDGTDFPLDGQVYADGGNVYGQGSALSGLNYVVYQGTGSSFTLTGLGESTQYSIMVFEYVEGDGDKNYQVTEYATATFTTGSEASHPVQWMDVTGAEADPQTGGLTKAPDLPSGGNAGAASIQQLQPGEDGWLEVTVEQTDKMRYFGLSSANTDNNFYTIDYAVALTQRYVIWVYEKGKSLRHSVPYAAGDRIAVARKDNTILYKKNDVVFLTSAVPSTGMLMADVSLKDQGSRLSNVMMSVAASSGDQVPDAEELVALTALYNQLGGTSWTNNTDWLSGSSAADFATWHGVTVVNGDVTAIDLSSNNLTGTIPAELTQLAALASINLSGNHLSGDLPEGLAGMSGLETLDLSENGFSFANLLAGGFQGTNFLYSPQDSVYIAEQIFAEVGTPLTLSTDVDRTAAQASKYQWFKNGTPLSEAPTEDGHTFTIPTVVAADSGSTYHYTIANDALPELTLTSTVKEVTMTVPEVQREALIALYNSTDGDNWTGIPEEKKWKQGGEFTEDIGNWFGVYVNAAGLVTSITLSNVGLSGPLPPEIGNLSTLTTLYIYNNQLTGPIPPEIGNLTELKTLLLSVNQLSGSIPAEIGNLSSLTSLTLSRNQLSGSIPSEIGNLSSLSSLLLSNNQLSGVIPSEIGNLSMLGSLVLSGNQLSGAIPETIGNLSELQNLTLTNNQLSGPIPAAIGNLSALYSLTLYNNQLSGAIPKEIGNLHDLEMLELQNNQLTAIPAEIGNLSSLSVLYVHDNQLTGPVPAEMGGLSALIDLRLDGNQLSGSIPAAIGNLSGLVSLSLANNQLSGAIPPEVGGLSALRRLLLQGNQLTGEIPAALWTITGLSDVRLSDNQLSGTLAPEIGSRPGLLYLYLDNNQLSGAIPTEMAGASRLLHIRLDHNELSGAIPAELGGLRWLKYLRLDHNRFSGSIPQSIMELHEMEDIIKAPAPTYPPPEVPDDDAHFQIQANKFTFADFPLSGTTSIVYAPQDSVDVSVSQAVGIGELLILLADIDRGTTPACKYQWYKDGVPLTDAPTEDGYTDTITVSGAADAGSYHYTITHDAVPALTLISRVQEVTLTVPPIQREALIALYNATDGDNWTDIPEDKKWKQDGAFTEDIGNWYGITLDGDRQVEEIDLTGHGLNGSIPPEIGGLSSLLSLSLNDNQLSGSISTEIGNLSALFLLNLSGNQLTSLDVSANTALTDLDCNSNQLTSLNVANGNNTSFSNLNTSANPNLTCIQVDDVEYSEANWTSSNFVFDPQLSFSEDCNYLSIPDPNFEQALINKGIDSNPVIDGKALRADLANVTILGVSNRSISDLTGIQGFLRLTKLYCHSNQLTSLDVSANTALTLLACASNELTSLDVSSNTKLTKIECNNNQLTSLNLGANTALYELNCRSNQLKNLDVSANTALRTLQCHDNQLTSFDLSSNTALTNLRCYSNQLTSLDVSANTSLTYLSCSSNQLTSLDVSANTALDRLYCDSNQLTTLDVSSNTALTELSCFSNQLTSLDLSNNTALTYLSCFSNQLTSLDVSANTALRSLSCYSNQLTNLDVSSNTLLEQLYCYNNHLTSLNVANGNNANFISLRAYNNPNLTCVQADDVAYSETNWTGSSSFLFDPQTSFSEDCIALLYVNIPDANFEQALIDLGIDSNPVIDGKVLRSEVEGVTSLDVSSKNISDLRGIEAFTALEQLYCLRNQLTSLDISANTALETLYCYDNQLTNIDLSNNTLLSHFRCYDNQLTSLDVSNNVLLERLYCPRNQLTSLDLSSNINLLYLNCNGNQLTSLDVSANTALERLYCYENQLASLDVSGNTALNRLQCYLNQLTSLNVANGNNTNFVTLKATDNPNLTCIQVDDVAYSEANWTGNDFVFDSQSEFSEDCNYVNIPDSNFEQALIDLGIDTNPVLDGKVCTANIENVISLDISDKNISDLTGIESFTDLELLYCDNNQLTSLDLSQNIVLTNLYCYNNQLTSLDISQNLALRRLSCHINQLTSLDVTQNTALQQIICYLNQLTTLDVSQNTVLTDLRCSYNQLTSLDCSQNTALEQLYCFANQLTSLDVTQNTLLERLMCYNNQLTQLNLANGNNTIIINIQAQNNSSLTCIQVDDVAYSNANWTGDNFEFDSQSEFSEDCAPIQQSQIEALIAFYNSTDGDHWTNIPEEKKWKQESQSGHEARNWEGITIDENGKVVQIDLQDKGLRGTVPEEISALSSLRVLDLSHNMLQGEVPVCLARMDNLEELYLNNNEFEGYMDLEFSVMPNIRVMALQHNDLVSIPDFSFNDYVDPAQVHLHAENNRLEFYYIENNLNGDGSDLLGAFTYMPQKVYGEPGTLGFVEGRELSLGMRMLGRANHYQWQLSSDNGGSWTDLEGDAPEYAKSSAAQGDEGWYRVKITNDRVHGDDDEILSAILKVQVATAPVLVNYPLN